MSDPNNPLTGAPFYSNMEETLSFSLCLLLARLLAIRWQPAWFSEDQPSLLGKEGTTVTVKAYVLVETAIGKLSHVLNQIRDLPNVTEANAVAGPYDVITVVQAETADEVGQLVLETIHNIEGVNFTMTCVAIGG